MAESERNHTKYGNDRKYKRSNYALSKEEYELLRKSRQEERKKNELKRIESKKEKVDTQWDHDGFEEIKNEGSKYYDPRCRNFDTSYNMGGEWNMAPKGNRGYWNSDTRDQYMGRYRSRDTYRYNKKSQDVRYDDGGWVSAQPSTKNNQEHNQEEQEEWPALCRDSEDNKQNTKRQTQTQKFYVPTKHGPRTENQNDKENSKKMYHNGEKKSVWGNIKKKKKNEEQKETGNDCYDKDDRVLKNIDKMITNMDIYEEKTRIQKSYSQRREIRSEKRIDGLQSHHPDRMNSENQNDERPYTEKYRNDISVRAHKEDMKRNGYKLDRAQSLRRKLKSNTNKYLTRKELNSDSQHRENRTFDHSDKKKSGVEENNTDTRTRNKYLERREHPRDNESTERMRRTQSRYNKNNTRKYKEQELRNYSQTEQHPMPEQCDQSISSIEQYGEYTSKKIFKNQKFVQEKKLQDA